MSITIENTSRTPICIADVRIEPGTTAEVSAETWAHYKDRTLYKVLQEQGVIKVGGAVKDADVKKEPPAKK